MVVLQTTPPPPQSQRINSRWYRLQVPWHPGGRLQDGTLPNITQSFLDLAQACVLTAGCAVKIFSELHMAPQSINHAPRSCNCQQHPILLMASCSASPWGHREHKVACTLNPLQGFSGKEKERWEQFPWGLLPGCLEPTGLGLSSTQGWWPTLAMEGQSQSYLFRGWCVQPMFDLNGVGPGEWGQMAPDWSLIKLLS